MTTSATQAIIDSLPQTAPADEHNRTLVEHVHPLDWQNPTPTGRYNMVVIGGGTAGLVTAAGAAGLGAKVALIERDLMGGDCLNVGCVPSKALIRCARTAFDARDAARFGVRGCENVRVDFAAVMERMRRLRAGISHHDSAARFRDLGVDVYIGEGRFASPNTIEVGGQTLHFARACIASGARAAAPPIEGLAETGYLTNETLFSLTTLPRRLGVIGAGPIGCEMAQSFARFGSQVTVIEMAPQVLIREDPDAAKLIEKALRDDGVKFVCNAAIKAVRRNADGKTLVVETGDDVRDISVDEILVSAGRKPNIETLNLEAAGIEANRFGVRVDDRLRTTNKRVFAAGDVCMQHKFTHAADAAARIVIQNALFFGRAKASALTIPWCTYTDPEIAHVGLYETDARKRGLEIDTYTIQMSDVDRAVLEGDDVGFLRVHTRKGRGDILGATLVARHAGDIISEVTAVMIAGGSLSTLGRTIHPYPTQAEVIKKAADAYSRTRLTPFVKKLFDTILRWTR